MFGARRCVYATVISYAMRVLLLLSLAYLLYACNARTLSEHDHEFKSHATDSLLLLNLSAKSKALNLSPITNGVDSFELRIWHGLSIATPNWLIILKYQDSAWHLTNTDYWVTYQWTNGSPGKMLLDSSFTKSLAVPSNIFNIVDSIHQFRLDTFPSQIEIPRFQDKVADGVFYQIEVATPKYYKAIRYSNPSRYTDTYNQQMSKLITMLTNIGVYSMP
jgi:hypothetical protein